MITNDMTTDVLIVGAGPVGLTLANSLARAHIACRIIEQAPTHQVQIRAKSLTPRTEEIFEDLGILDQIHARGERNLRMQFYEREHFLRAIDPAADPATQPTPDAPYRGTFWIGQNNTQTVLREHLAAMHVQVELDSRLEAVTQQADHVLAQVNHAGKSETIQARYLVGCDGGRSTVRHCGNFSFVGETMQDEPHLNIGVRVRGLDSRYAHLWMSAPEGFFGFTPMRYDGVWMFQARVESSFDSSLAACQRLFAERSGRSDVQITELLWGPGPLHKPNARLVNQYRDNRIFLAGDAAHVHSAAGGQGMNTGIGDAYNLGWKLAHVLRGAPAALLDSYQAERLPVAQGVLASTTIRHQAYLNRGTGVDRAQSMLHTLTGKDPIADTTQLSLTYRGSPLACDLDDATGLRAGDRAPDSPFLFAANGQKGRLFALFRGPHFTLLAFGEQPALHFPDADPDLLQVYTITRGGHRPSSSDRALIDIDGYIHHFYGIQGNALILVRPDGYIGLTGSDLGVQPILDYLHKITGR